MNIIAYISLRKVRNDIGGAPVAYNALNDSQL